MRPFRQLACRLPSCLALLGFILLFSGCSKYQTKISLSSASVIKNGTPFVSVWQTTTPNESITLPLRSGFKYDFTIDWGDSTKSKITSFDDTDAVHFYSDPGDHKVEITGTVEAWSFNGGGDATKLIRVIDLGSVGFINLQGAFYGCTNLTDFAGGDTSAVTDMSYMFANTFQLKTIDLANFDTSNVTSMEGMFVGNTGLTSLDLSNFDTSNVTSMKSMFMATVSLTSLDLSNFDTSNVTSMHAMFSSTGASNLNLSSFNTSNVESMARMFEGVANLTSLDLASFDTSRVRYMYRMFCDARALSGLNLSRFDTTSVDTMASMFEGATALTALDLSHFNTANVNDMLRLFYGAVGLTSLNTNGWIINPTASLSGTVLDGVHPGIVVTCDQGGLPASGTFFGSPCH